MFELLLGCPQIFGTLAGYLLPEGSNQIFEFMSINVLVLESGELPAV